MKKEGAKHSIHRRTKKKRREDHASDNISFTVGPERERCEGDNMACTPSGGNWGKKKKKKRVLMSALPPICRERRWTKGAGNEEVRLKKSYIKFGERDREMCERARGEG